MRTTYLGIDAAVRTWLNDQPGYLPPVGLGEVIRAAGVGEVVETRCDAYAVGDVVTTLSGFQEYVDRPRRPVHDGDPRRGRPAGHAVRLRLHRRHRLLRHDRHRQAAAGRDRRGVGRRRRHRSLAGQIAKIAGARVVGIAGGPEKCRVVVEEFGFDACIDHRAGDLTAQLKEHCPKRVDVYFDNVGGPILDAVLGRLAPKARVALCGVISSYLTGEHPGPANYVNLLAKNALMQGFNTLDQWGRFEEAFASLKQWEAEGRLVHREHVLRRASSRAVDALNGLFTGANIGKTVVKISEPTPV